MGNDSRALATMSIKELSAFTGTPTTADKIIIYDASENKIKTRSAASSYQRIVPICGNAKVGATAGWVITGGTNICHATLPASQTNSTLVVPITGLNIGDTITAVSATGQVESAGGNVTCTMSIRKLTNAAADNTDAELGTDNVGTLTADTILSSANLGVTGLTEVLAEGETIYALFTATTAASTDIDLTGLVITVTSAI